jgi:hypothetical protein
MSELDARGLPHFFEGDGGSSDFAAQDAGDAFHGSIFSRGGRVFALAREIEQNSDHDAHKHRDPGPAEKDLLTPSQHDLTLQ